MTHIIKDVVLPAKLQLGDRVRFVLPASPVSKDSIGTKALEDLGLVVEYGKYVYDAHSTIDYLGRWFVAQSLLEEE
jgi:hypothetical protein